MIKVYFDDVLIDTDSYVQLDNDYKLFTDSFKLGSVASDTFSLGVIKNAVSTHPINVRIEDDTTIFNFVVDKIVEDDNVYTYSLTDKLLNFNFEYDASILINDKATNEEECYLSDIWKDMCDKADVEYDETYVFENDIVVNWYDNRVQARRYLSFIAELQSGYACILENGKQSFKKQNRSSVKTIDADECSDLIVGEKKKITRVVYDGGAFKWEYGYFEGNTLYLQSDNVFIVNETIVENIYNNIKNFEFYIIDVPDAPIDSSIRAGDIITFNDNGKEYPTIAQYKISYAGGWTGGYKIAVNTDRQQETQVIKDKDNIRNLGVKVDRLNNEFSIIAEEVGENSSKISTFGQTIDGFLQTVNKVDELENRTNMFEQTVDGMKQSMTYSGGYNLVENCVKQFGEAGWTGNFTNVTNTEIQQNSLTKSALNFNNGEEVREIQVPNGIYNFSCRYKKLIELAVCKITINGIEVILDSTEWEEKELTFEVKSNTINFVFLGDTNNSCWLVNLLFIPGDTKQTWTPNPNEINTGTIKAGGDTLSIEATGAKTKFEAKTDGIRIIDTDTNNAATEFTKEGTKTDKLEAKTAVIAGLSFSVIGNQVVLKVVDR